MIRIDSLELYQASLRSLKAFVPSGYPGQLVQIFFAARYLGQGVPRVGSGYGIKFRDLEHTLDRFYTRNSRQPAEGSVASIFSNNHLVPTGQRREELSSDSNIWRNVASLQKGKICFASDLELMDDAFLRQPRIECPHLQPQNPETLKGASCALSVNSVYRNDGPKGLRKAPDDGSFTIVDPANLNHWAAIVARRDIRLPILPLIVALYYDADIAGGRVEIDTVDFRRDFAFTLGEFGALFDDDPSSPANQDLSQQFAALSLAWTQAPPVQVPRTGTAPAPSQPRVPPRRTRGRQSPPLDPDDLPEQATRTGPPAGGHWWSAEQAVETYLSGQGWTVVNRTGQRVGFDFEIRWRGSERRYFVEVKSSVGPCQPSLTRTEFEAAQRHGRKYVLAIVEQFDPTREASILWVRNPACLPLSLRTVEQYPIPRSVWLPRADAEID